MTRIASALVVFTLVAWAQSAPAVAVRGSLSQAAPAEAALKPVPAQLPDVVAGVNGETISKGELESAIAQLQSRAGRAVPADQRDQVFRSVLDQLIAYHLLVQESTARSIAVPDADLDTRISEIRSQFPSQEAFVQTLEQRMLTMAELRTNLRQGMQIDKMLEAELAATATVTTQQVEEFYAGNSSEFQRGERVRASHILIRVADGADATTKDQARTRAADILEEVNGGQDFAALATRHSEDPGSAPGGGDLGYFEHGQMVPPFEEAAFSLATAQTSSLVETPFGYHIIKVTDKQPPRTIPLAEVRGEIEKFLQTHNREQHTQTFVESLRMKGKVEIFI